jgi:hypothetical protein
VSSVLTHAAATSAVVLAAVFLTAAALKLRSFRVFVERLAEFELVPSAVVVPAAAAIVAWELVVGLAVLARPALGAWLAAGTLAGFAAVVAVTWLRGKRNIACACFGQARAAPLGWHVVVRNVGLASLAVPASAAAADASPAEALVGGVALLMYLSLLVVLTEGLRTAETLRAQRAVLALPDSEDR